MRRSNEPLFWSMFSAGGVVTALLAPVLILLTGLLLPLEVIEVDDATDLLSNGLVRLVVFGVFVLALLHWANRFRHTLVDMGLKPLGGAISALSYLVVVLATVWAGSELFA